MKEEKQNKEYRSEKVQAILGEIPASLEHFGFIAIGAVILCILSIFYFTPYKQIYSGTVVIHGVKSFEPSDSTETDILLHFEKTRLKMLKDYYFICNLLMANLQEEFFNFLPLVIHWTVIMLFVALKL